MNALLTGMEWLPDLPGGLNRYFHGLVHALPAVGVRGTALVSYLSCAQPDGVQPNGAIMPVRVQPMAPQGSSLVRVLRGARDAARSALANADVINVHFALYALSWVRNQLAQRPLVIHFHGPWADEVAAEASGPRGRIRALVARRLELAVYRRATRFVTLSESFARLLRERYGIAEERIRVIPGGVDLTSFFSAPDREPARTRLGWPTDRPILLTVRRLVHRVGLELLVDAMGHVRRTCPDALLLIGGKGPLAGELHRRIDAAGLTEHVRLLGMVPESELPLVYAAADVSVVPSIKLEGFGLVTAESLASGTPVLGTPVGGTPEILRGLDESLIFESASVTAMVDRLTAALHGRVQLPTRERCRAHAARFDWHQVAPRIRGVYDEAIHASHN